MIDNLSFDDVKEKTKKCIRLLLKNNFFLIKVKAHERSIAHKLAEHLQIEFPDWHVDCKYNRNKLVKKNYSLFILIL